MLEAARRSPARPRVGRSCLRPSSRRAGPPAFAGLLESGAAERLRLDPLDEDATAEIAALYAPGGVAVPMRTLLAESEGLPLRIHRAASGWAQAQVAERLEAATEETAVDQHGLREGRAKVAGGIAELRLTWSAGAATSSRSRPDPSEPQVCPYRGLAPFDAAHAEYFFGRERLVAELVARLVGLDPARRRRSLGQRQVLGGARRPPAGAGRRRRPGLGGLAPGGDAPGRAPAGRALAGPGPGGARGGDEGAAPWIADALERLPDGERLVLLIDQFEEAFVACRDQAEREAFFDAGRGRR